jgi:hypothetical protein
MMQSKRRRKAKIGSISIATLAIVTVLFAGPLASKSGAYVPSLTPSGSTPYLTSVSCSNTSLCMAVDGDGFVWQYNGTVWSGLDLIDSYDPGAVLYGVSCDPTGALCVAVDSEGYAYTWNGTSWSSSGDVDSGDAFLSVSCATSTFCVAADDQGNVVTYNGTSWSSVTSVAGSVDIYGVSCVSSSFCVITTSTGYAWIWNGTSWSSSLVASGVSLNSVSCASSVYCVAVDNEGNAYTYTGTTPWSSASSIDGTNVLYGVSCTSSTFCAAVDADGNTLLYNGTGWSSTNPDGTYTINAVSCVSTDFCFAVDNDGNAVYYGGATPWTVSAVDPSFVINDISCVPDYEICGIAGAGAHSAITTSFWSGFDGPSGPFHISGGPDFQGVSCTQLSTCMVVGGRNAYTMTTSGLTVSGTGITPSGVTLQSVGCWDSSGTLKCWAGGSNSDAWYFNGTTWSGAYSTGLGSSVVTMSCFPTSLQCYAGGSSGGTAESTSSTTWGSGGPGGAEQGLTCVSGPACQGVSSTTDYYLGGSYNFGSDMTGVSCSDSNNCEIVQSGTANGTVYYTTVGSFSSSNRTQVTHAVKGTSANAIACIGDGECAAAGTKGSIAITTNYWVSGIDTRTIKL